MNNKIIRVCAQKDPKLETFAITRGIMIITFNEKKNFAYGVGYKVQSGNSWGDYHIIGALQEDSIWSFNVGNFQPFDGFYDEYAETASKISDNFNIVEAKKYFDNFDDGSMYSLSKKFKINLDYDYEKILKNCTGKEKELFAFDEQGYPNSKGEYYDSNFCFLSDLNGFLEYGGYLWYRIDKCEDVKIDLEDEIPYISSLIPGKIHFMT